MGCLLRVEKKKICVGMKMLDVHYFSYKVAVGIVSNPSPLGVHLFSCYVFLSYMAMHRECACFPFFMQVNETSIVLYVLLSPPSVCALPLVMCSLVGCGLNIFEWGITIF